MATAEEGAAFINYMSDVSVAMINAASSDKERKEAQKHAEQMAEEAYQRDVEFWERNNEYNSPEERRKRLEQAGISPWTEYGQMTSESPMIKSPIAETLPPTQGLQLPQTNMFAKYLSLKKLNNENKMLESSLQRQAAETRYKELENASMEYYLNNQMTNDILFKKAEHEEARKAWERSQESHDKLLEQYERQREEYEYSKTQRKYDEQGRQALLDEKAAQLEATQQAIAKSQEEVENIKKQYEILDEQHKQAIITTKETEAQVELSKAERDKKLRQIRKGEEDTDPWFIRKVYDFQQWQEEQFGRHKTGTIKLDPVTGKWVTWYNGQWREMDLDNGGKVKDSNDYEE